jgi:C-terminal processing protease CtpA/Prc
MTNAQNTKKYSAQEVKDDLKYMYETLEKSTYDLYALVKKEEMDRSYQAINSSIHDSYSVLEVYRLFQPFVAKVRMSHCFLFNPWGEYQSNYLKQGGTVFPLDFYFFQGKVYVKDNFSTNKSISKSDEILSFNEVPIDQYMTEFCKNLSGPSDYFTKSLIERYTFPRSYWFYYGECKEFKIKIKKKDGEELDIVVNAISGSDFEDQLKKPESDTVKEREFYLINDTVAYLRPGKFLNADVEDDLEKQNTFDNTEFRHFIDSAFNVFAKEGSKDLIIDLRDNMGGDNSFSDYMIAYFATKPFSIASKFRMKTSQMTKSFWKDVEIPQLQDLKNQIMSLEDGSYLDVDLTYTEPHAESKRFKGKVYVLINRYSYSNTASVAAIIQDYKFGEIIGEETSDEVTSYGAMHVFKLPNTQLSVSYPKGFMVRPNGDTTPRGVVPNHVVYDDLHTDKDEILEYTLKLIEEDKAIR